jgi:hypothetical protein
MGVDHGGGDIRVAQQFLHRADIRTACQQMSGKGVAQGVGGDPLGKAGLLGRLADSRVGWAKADRPCPSIPGWTQT